MAIVRKASTTGVCNNFNQHTSSDTVKLDRLTRALNMRDIILALMHVYCMPTAFQGYMDFDFGYFRVAFAGPQAYGGDRLHLMVWDCDEHKVLNLYWNEAGEVKLVTYKPGWWEDEIGDIDFWDEKVTWKPNGSSASLNPVDQHVMLPPTAHVGYAAERHAKLRYDALSFANGRMLACYAVGDRARGTKWEQALAAMSLGGQPLDSKHCS